MITKLETQRLILRKPKISDWKDIIEGAGRLEIAKMTTQIPHPYHKKDALEWIKKSREKWGKDRYPFLIELKSERKVIGCMDIHQIDKFVGKASTGSWIGKKYQQKGYITEAKVAANNFAFDTLKLRKLNSSVFTDNKASNKTQLRMGYKLEGTLKKESRSVADGRIHDSNKYGLFKEDWKKNLPKVKKRLNAKIEKLK